MGVRILQLREADQLQADETAIVVDVLRATSTIAVALHGGARSITPALTPDDAKEKAAALDDAVLVGERARGPLPGFVDNSPATLAAMDLQGKDVVLTTTNGTKALLACKGAGRVVAGSLVNASALRESLAGQPVALVASGWMGRPTRDDDACCAYLAALLNGGKADLEATVERIEESTSGTKLREHGRGADVDLCIQQDAAPVVPALGPDGAMRQLEDVG